MTPEEFKKLLFVKETVEVDPHKLPGTVVLITIFFVSFVLYYFINWKYLSELWLFR